MKNTRLRLILSFLLLVTVSCDEPETVVTNVVNKGGSVWRKVEMRSSENDFRQSNIQIPVDTTWNVRDTVIISEKEDTTWIRTADKLFADASEIDRDYRNDSSYNNNTVRSAVLSMKFRWFNTIYRYSEKIEKIFSNGYPVSGFMNKEELLWFYTPGNDQEARLKGADSTRYDALSDSVNNRTDEWFLNSIMSEWVHEFSGQIYSKDQRVVHEDTLKLWEKRLLSMLQENEDDFDSLWDNGIALEAAVTPDMATRYRVEADSAMSLVEEKITLPFKQYSIRISMPGRLTGSNGFADSSQMLLWPVISEYFLAEDYEMWAESKVPNFWAWGLSGVFVLFVFTGLIIRKKKRG